MILNFVNANILILRKALFLILFTLFINPYSLTIVDQGVSANYLFVLFPFFVFLIKGQIYKPERNVFVLMLLLFIVFIVASLYQDGHLFWRAASFLVFMSMFALLFVKVDPDMVESFKGAIVLYSVYVIIMTMIDFFDQGGNELGTYAKGLVGTQRIGFVYIMAFWIVLLHKTRGILFIIIKHVAVFIIFSGIFLTFSRTSIFALSVSVGVYFSMATIFHIKNYKSFWYVLRRLFLSIIYIVMLVTFLSSFFQVTIDQYKKNIFVYMSKTIPVNKGQPLLKNVSNDANVQERVFLKNVSNDANVQERVFLKDARSKGTSIGYRVYMSDKVLDYVVKNPFTGSGFLGVWTMFENREGSAHSQYLDVFFRIGFFGFIFYMFILYKMSIFLYKKDTALCIGFIGILAYGLFHETFKLSQGGFIFAFLLAFYYQNRHILKKNV